MNISITSELFSDFLLCKYKAYLKISGEVGNKLEFSEIDELTYNKYHNSVCNLLKDKNIAAKTISNCSFMTLIEKPFDVGLPASTNQFSSVGPWPPPVRLTGAVLLTLTNKN